jgi:hypothetical protein
MKKVLPWYVCWLVMPVQEPFILPWLLCSAQYNIFFLTVHYFNSCVPIAQQPGQAGRAGPPVSECSSPAPYLLLLLLLNRLPTDITVGQGLKNDIFYNLYNFFKQNITILARIIYESVKGERSIVADED